MPPRLIRPIGAIRYRRLESPADIITPEVYPGDASLLVLRI
jgi:hypothetical protein